MVLFSDHHVPTSRCPFCENEMDGAANVEGGRGPIPGDFTICIHCAQPLIFLAGLQLGKPKPGEFEAVCRIHKKFGIKMRATIAIIRNLDRKRRSS